MSTHFQNRGPKPHFSIIKVRYGHKAESKPLRILTDNFVRMRRCLERWIRFAILLILSLAWWQGINPTSSGWMREPIPKFILPANIFVRIRSTFKRDISLKCVHCIASEFGLGIMHTYACKHWGWNCSSSSIAYRLLSVLELGYQRTSYNKILGVHLALVFGSFKKFDQLKDLLGIYRFFHPVDKFRGHGWERDVWKEGFCPMATNTWQSLIQLFQLHPEFPMSRGLVVWASLPIFNFMGFKSEIWLV